MSFKPDYNNVIDAAFNREAKRVPLYEHNVHTSIMETMMNEKFVFNYFMDKPNYNEFFKSYCDFFLKFGYDTVTYEATINEILPFGGALGGHKQGYIDSVEKFESYPFDSVKDIYIDFFDEKLKALRKNIPDGMQAIGGVGNGVFEIVQDLCGYENLCILSFDEPEMYSKLFVKVGDMMESIWKWFLSNYGDIYCVCRFGDDLGFKSNTLLPHEDIKTNIIPQYKRIADLIHSYNKPFLLHSCGNIFPVMEDIIAAGINAKHSNEDQISPFSEWVDKYGDRIGNFGGIDTDHLVRKNDDDLKKIVVDTYNYCAKGHGGFCLGSGNSIPDYVNPNKYGLMIETVRKLRGE